MKTYLVTGAAGFIGSHLCDALLAAGSRVIALDDLSTGHPRNLRQHEANPRLELTVGSVLDRRVLGPLVERAGAVFHLAAAVGVRLIVEKPVHTVETNVLGTALVLELAAAEGVPVLLTSSSEVYGKGMGVPFSEDGDLVFGHTGIARWSYGCSKALDEFLALAYARERSLPAIVVRLFNTAGPRQTGRYGMVLPRFVRQALRGEPLTVYGDGRQSRCFCDVADVVDALVELVERRAGVGGVTNLGSDEEVTIRDLAERVRALAASASEIVQVPYGDAWDEQFEDMRRRVPDLSRVRELIGFRPRRTLDDIIRRVVEHEKTADRR